MSKKPKPIKWPLDVPKSLTKLFMNRAIELIKIDIERQKKGLGLTNRLAKQYKDKQRSKQ